MFAGFFAWLRKQFADAAFGGIIDGSGQAVRVLTGGAVSIDPAAAEAARLQLTAQGPEAAAPKAKRIAK